MTYHFVGIGGVSMSGIAQLLLNRGETVTGSDRQESADIEKLRKLGAKISIGHSEANVENPDMVVYTAAVKWDNPELREAKRRNIPCVLRADFLGQIMQDFKASIAISGTHGKTTTTGMIACIAKYAGIEPTIMIGGNLPQIGGNVEIGEGELLILEACEYVDSFLAFNPKIAVVTNIEADHLDYFSGGIAQIRDSFQKFLEKLPRDGFAIINKDNKNASIVAKKAETIAYYVSLDDPSADFHTENLRYINGKADFDVVFEEGDQHITLNVYGEHNVYNALCAFAVCYKYGISQEKIAEGLKDFIGTGRRFELRGEYAGVKIYDDYAHHPTEIKTTFATAENLTGEKYFIFQPHTYTRTRALWDDFVEVLKIPKNIIIADIYSARENPIKDITSENLAKAVGCEYIEGGLEEIGKTVKTRLKKGDNIICVGAGDVNKICEMLLADVQVTNNK